MTETKTILHFCIDLDMLLRLTRGGVTVLVDNDGKPLTEYQVYQVVNNEKEHGYFYFCDAT